MLEKADHYSNKGGHLKRSLVNKLLAKGIISNKCDVSFRETASRDYLIMEKGKTTD